MRFALFILVNAMLFIRPAELMPWLGNFQVYLVTILACFLVSWPAVLDLCRRHERAAPPALACAVGVLGAILLSGLVNGDADALLDHVVEFAKVLIYLLLLVSLVNTPERLRRFLGWIGLFSTMTALLATIQYHGAIDIARPETPGQRGRRGAFVEERFRDSSTGQMVVVRRMCGTGLFNDPNDLGLVLVTGVPIALFGVSRRERGLGRWLWLGPLAIFLYALVLTHSRGSLLALLAGLAVLFMLRFGRRRSMLAGLAVFPLLLAFFAGRMTDISTSDGTGQGRIQLWSDGLLMFRESPLWGVGMHQFVTRARLVAHNSFIHCFAELGLLGGGLFLGAFVLTLAGLVRLARAQERIGDAEMRRALPYVTAMFAAFLVGILFLSRSYVVPTYTVLGMAIAYLRVAPSAAGTGGVDTAAGAEAGGARLVPRPGWTVAIASLAFLMASEGFVRLLAR